MGKDHDVAAFSERSRTYEAGYRGKLHHDIIDATLRVCAEQCPHPSRVLDIGCGTGYLLRRMAVTDPGISGVGIDPAPGMVAEAKSQSQSFRNLSFVAGTAEELPFDDESFDCIVTTTSFDHWKDQRRGVEECFRTLRPGGTFVCVDLFTWLLLPTLAATHRGKARTTSRMERLASDAGFARSMWFPVYPPIIKGILAVRPD